MTNKEFEKQKLEIMLHRYGGTKGFRSYLLNVIIVVAVTLIAMLTIFVVYVENLRR